LLWPIADIQQVFSTFSRPGATFTFSYQPLGHSVINEDKLFKCQGSLFNVLQTFLKGFMYNAMTFFNKTSYQVVDTDFALMIFQH
jgi:hypothetical protein